MINTFKKFKQGKISVFVYLQTCILPLPISKKISAVNTPL